MDACVDSCRFSKERIIWIFVAFEHMGIRNKNNYQILTAAEATDAITERDGLFEGLGGGGSSVTFRISYHDGEKTETKEIDQRRRVLMPDMYFCK